MKKVILTTMLSLAMLAGASTVMAKDGGGGNGSPRMEAFNGDVNKATEAEKKSNYYKLDKAMADMKAANAQKDAGKVSK